MAKEQILSEMQSLIYSDKFKKTLLDTKDKDIIIFLGNTRAGKSTTVNYVIGNTLSAVPAGKGKFKIVNATEVFQGPKIGMGSQSETTVPTSWNSSKVSGLVVDAPGFDDNRGEAQDVANAFYIRELIKNVKSIKFVLIADIQEVVNDNVSSFVNLMDKVYSMLPEINKLKNGILIVFTKDAENFSEDEICDIIKEKILDQTSLKIKNRELTKFFVENKKHVILVKMPTAEGILKENDHIFADLIPAIENQATKLSRESLTNISLGISDRSKSFLLGARTDLLEFKQLDESMSLTESAFKNHIKRFEWPFDTVSRGNEKLNQLNDLDQKLKTLIESPKSVIGLLQDLRALLPNASALKDLTLIDMKLNFVSFVDQILKMSQSATMDVKVKNSLGNMRGVLVGYINNTRSRIVQINTEETAKRLAAEEAARKLREQQELARLAELQRQHEENQRRIEQLERERREREERSRLQKIADEISNAAHRITAPVRKCVIQ